jgi:hypothetical protein
MHTPGPWTVTLGDTIAGAPAYWLIEGAGGVVGDVQSVNADDARLIAAAPQMLRALQRLTRPDDGRGPADDDLAYALDVIRAATGEA